MSRHLLSSWHLSDLTLSSYSTYTIYLTTYARHTLHVRHELRKRLKCVVTHVKTNMRLTIPCVHLVFHPLLIIPTHVEHPLFVLFIVKTNASSYTGAKCQSSKGHMSNIDSIDERFRGHYHVFE